MLNTIPAGVLLTTPDLTRQHNEKYYNQLVLQKIQHTTVISEQHEKPTTCVLADIHDVSAPNITLPRLLTYLGKAHILASIQLT